MSTADLERCGNAVEVERNAKSAKVETPMGFLEGSCLVSENTLRNFTVDKILLATNYHARVALFHVQREE
jgi:hypothetical protein